MVNTNDGPLSPLSEVARYFIALIPSKDSFKKPHFNYITLHYMYMVLMSIIGSIMLFPAGPSALMEYIDALFFAAGMATQSGLNTIDVNLLHTYQQVVMMLLTCLCTPIFINTCVVFVRLYWFEKRFEHIVKEARAKAKRGRRFTLSRSKSQMQTEKDPRNSAAGKMEAGGVQGKRIIVNPETARFIDRNGNDEDTEKRREQFREKVGPSIGLEPSNDSPLGSTCTRTNSKDKDANTASSDSTVAVPAVHVDGEHEYPSPKTQSQALAVPIAHVDGDLEHPSPKTQSHALAVPVAHVDEEHDHPSPKTQPETQFMGLNPKLLHREITFADEAPPLGRESPELARVPEQRDVSKHVEFLERQQANAKKGGALYIPGPRDFDRGEKPEAVDDDDLVISRLHKASSFGGPAHRSRSEDGRSVMSHDDRQAHRGITINLPEHPAHRERAATKSKDDEDDIDEDEEEKSRFARMISGLDRRRHTRVPSISEGRRSFARAWTNLTGPPKDVEPMPYFSWTATTGRNSIFMGLTSEQREELGGIEYRALKTLAKILIAYYVGFHVLGMVVLLPWIRYTQPWNGVVVEDGQNPSWWGVFTPASMFNDLGFTLTPDSMISFQSAVLPLLFGSFLIIIGNTGFPCMLRFIIWTLSKIVSYESEMWKELRFLLDHPRRCFTLLFPSKATWWLFWVLIGLNLLDLVFFIILDINQPVVSDLHPGVRVLNGWFQATSTRTAGFASVNLADLHAAIQVSYMIMMYISVFPIAISVRRTNVYEEKSLGIFGGEEDVTGEGEQSYVSQHLRRQLSFDLWYIFLGLFIIAIVEGDRISNTNEPAFTMFSVLFEIVSAYGTVGLSLGYPGINASFSAEFRTISKLVIIAMMIRGRHRGLPYALDRAILLPSDKLQQREQEEAERQLVRRGSMFAEENQNMFPRKKTWEQGELDQWGLPAQHTRPHSRADHATTVGSGGDHEPEGLRRVVTRRSTALSNKSGTGAVPSSPLRTRGRSLSRVIVGGLSAGPTWSKRD